eukprot:2228633-Prymnesium_polylepis.1
MCVRIIIPFARHILGGFEDCLCDSSGHRIPKCAHGAALVRGKLKRIGEVHQGTKLWLCGSCPLVALLAEKVDGATGNQCDAIIVNRPHAGARFASARILDMRPGARQPTLCKRRLHVD